MKDETYVMCCWHRCQERLIRVDRLERTLRTTWAVEHDCKVHPTGCLRIGSLSDWRKAAEGRSRKVRTCDACRETIRVGDRYGRTASLYDGRWQVTERCLRCEKIYRHLVDKCSEHNAGANPDEERIPELALDCGLSYEDEWGECPEEIAALAFALPGEINA